MLVKVALSLTWFLWGSLCFPILLVPLGPLGTGVLWFRFLPDGVSALGPGLAPQKGYVAVWAHSGIWESMKHTIFLTGRLVWSHQSGLAGIQPDKQKLQLIEYKYTQQSRWVITRISNCPAYRLPYCFFVLFFSLEQLPEVQVWLTLTLICTIKP